MVVRVSIEIQVPDRLGERWTQTRHRRFAEPVDEGEVAAWKRAVLADIPRGQIVTERRRTEL